MKQIRNILPYTLENFTRKINNWDILHEHRPPNERNRTQGGGGGGENQEQTQALILTKGLWDCLGGRWLLSSHSASPQTISQSLGQLLSTQAITLFQSGLFNPECSLTAARHNHD